MEKSKLLWLCAVLMLPVSISSCSGDGIEWKLVCYQTSFHADAYAIGYSLRNEDGDRATTFKEGENIIFDVTIFNATGYELHMADERNILMSVMSVYRSDGEYVGNPFQSAFYTMELRWITVEAHGRLHWSCSWIYDERYVHDDRYGSSTSYSTKVLSNVAPLPKGTYYVMIKSNVMYRIADEPTPGGGTSGNDDIELRIPFTVE
jgi:hypothetical protein